MQNNIFSIQNKKTIITGGSRGIGLCLAKNFFDLGSDVTIFDKISPNEKSNIDFIKCNIGEYDSIKKSVNKYYKKNKTPDILVNCAAITLPEETIKYSKYDWDKTLSVNLSGIFFLCKEVGSLMIKNKIQGSIINFTSIGAEQGFANNPAYGATKGGVKLLTKSLAVEWGAYRIRVNNIVPGYTNTPMNNKSWHNKKLKNQRSNNTILKRWADPEEMVGPAIFLASDASSYITGSDIIVDGGWLTKGMK